MKLMQVIEFLCDPGGYIADSAAPQINDKIKKSFFSNLKALIIFLLGICVVYFFPNNGLSLFVFSLLLLISISYKIISFIARNVNIETLKIVLQAPFSLLSLIAVLFTFRLSELVVLIQLIFDLTWKLVLRILPSAVLFACYMLAVTFILKPILLETIAGMTSLQIYLYPIFYAIDYIFKTSSLSLIGL